MQHLSEKPAKLSCHKGALSALSLGRGGAKAVTGKGEGTGTGKRMQQQVQWEGRTKGPGQMAVKRQVGRETKAKSRERQVAGRRD